MLKREEIENIDTLTIRCYVAAHLSVIQHLASYLPKWKLNFALLSPPPS